MSVYDELKEAMLAVSNPREELEKRGFTEHDELRRFVEEYALEVAQGIAAHTGVAWPGLAEHLGASFVGGFYLGLDYEQRRWR